LPKVKIVSVLTDDRPGAFAKLCSERAGAGGDLRYASASTPPAARNR
jgi:hypothetical protein